MKPQTATPSHGKAPTEVSTGLTEQECSRDGCGGGGGGGARQGEVEYNDAVIQDRQQGIEEIHEQILEVNEIFQDLAVLVNDQVRRQGTQPVKPKPLQIEPPRLLIASVLAVSNPLHGLPVCLPPTRKSCATTSGQQPKRKTCTPKSTIKRTEPVDGHQGAMLDDIESNMVRTSAKTRDAIKELKQADKSQRSSRNRMCCLMFFFLTVLAILIVVLIKT
jgi:hypothetical protein